MRVANGAITLDGRLAESAWESAGVVSDFVQKEPVEGAAPSERTEVAVAEVGGKIYVVGGFGGQRELEIYDPAADRWSRGAAIPRTSSRSGGGPKRSLFG